MSVRSFLGVETATDRAKAVADVVNAVGNDPRTLELSIRAVLEPESRRATERLYLVLVWTLVVLLFLALGGVIWLTVDGSTETEPDALIGVFAALLSGSFGLFAPSPLRGGPGGGGGPPGPGGGPPGPGAEIRQTVEGAEVFDWQLKEEEGKPRETIEQPETPQREREAGGEDALQW